MITDFYARGSRCNIFILDREEKLYLCKVITHAIHLCAKLIHLSKKRVFARHLDNTNLRQESRGLLIYFIHTRKIAQTFFRKCKMDEKLTTSNKQ